MNLPLPRALTFTKKQVFFKPKWIKNPNDNRILSATDVKLIAWNEFLCSIDEIVSEFLRFFCSFFSVFVELKWERVWEAKFFIKFNFPLRYCAQNVSNFLFQRVLNSKKKNVFRMILCTLRAINPTNYNRDSIIFTFRWFRKWKKISVYHRAQVKLTYSRKKCTRGNYAVKEAWRCPALWGQITLFIIENFTTKKWKF